MRRNRANLACHNPLGVRDTKGARIRAQLFLCVIPLRSFFIAELGVPLHSFFITELGVPLRSFFIAEFGDIAAAHKKAEP